MANRKARLTQRLANSYPKWSEIRENEQSTGQQFLNAIGEQFDILSKRLHDEYRNFQLANTNPNDLGLCYKVKLPLSYTFSKYDEDNTVNNFTTPVVSGLYNGTYYLVSQVENNDIPHFWRDAVPDRYTLEETLTSPNQYVLSSGYPIASPFAILPTSGELPLDNHIYITLSGATSCFDVRDDNFIEQGIVRIQGTTRFGTEVVEEIYPTHDDTFITTNQYSVLSGVKVYNIEENDEAFLTLSCLNFNNQPYYQTYQIDHDYWFGTPTRSFWTIDSGNATALLTHNTDLYPEPEMLTAGYAEVLPIVSQELKDTSGNNIRALDMTVMPNTDHIWVADNFTIYCFDTDLPYYSNLASTKKKTDDSVGKIITSSDFVNNGETIDIDYYWRYPAQGAEKYRVWVEDENGTKYVITNGSLTSYVAGTDYWTYDEPQTRFFGTDANVSFPSSGAWTIILQVGLPDQTIHTDKRVVIVEPSKNALCEFDLSGEDISAITGIDVSSDGDIWLLDEDQNLHKIELHYDQMLVDYQDKVLYFRENYDEVIIEDD